MQERLAAEEWLAVATSMLGTVGLGVSSEDADQIDPKRTSLLGVVGLGVLFVLLPSAFSWINRWRDTQKRKHIANAKTLAIVYGLQVWLDPYWPAREA